jgi:hypothetical protein
MLTLDEEGDAGGGEGEVLGVGEFEGKSESGAARRTPYRVGYSGMNICIHARDYGEGGGTKAVRPLKKN